MENKGFKKLIGLRVLLSLPVREDYGIQLTPEVQAELEKEFAEKLVKLEIYEVGDGVKNYKPGDLVYVPTEDLRRGTYLEINKETKLMINAMSIAIVW